jgi:hypothetical protein
VVVRRPADGYDELIEAGSRVLHRDKMIGGWKWQVLLMSPALVAVGVTAVTASTSEPWLAVIAAAGVAVATILPIWVLFSVLRITVSTERVHVQYGLFGPEIPVAAIQSAVVTEYRTIRTGYGIRYLGHATWLYNMLGAEGMAVRIEWLDGATRKTTIVSSNDPAALVMAIRQAQVAVEGCAALCGEEPPPEVTLEAGRAAQVAGSRG